MEVDFAHVTKDRLSEIGEPLSKSNSRLLVISFSGGNSESFRCVVDSSQLESKKKNVLPIINFFDFFVSLAFWKLLEVLCR